jgi:hypothetical protein
MGAITMTFETSHIASIPIEKKKEADFGVIIVKTFANREIGLGISLKRHGDLEIYFNKRECLKVIEALRQAMDSLQG